MVLAENKKARFDYDVLEDYEAGIELLGLEAKSLRVHGAQMDGSYVTIRGGEAYLMQTHIPPYQPSNTPKEYDPNRTRRLILTKAEIRDLADVEQGKGLTIVPIRVYTKGPKIKVAVAIVRGKKKFDKRESIKERETDREIRRTLKYDE
ncbi:MAG TPA: SsrA-binding protein SmpB [Candidatus Paceibacterota bacterium]|nr:SsrA-binding protein SmpB [Candidatus Paceibacterota bacterium]